MDQKVLEFLTSHRVCSLTTLLSDGAPHAAALHFSHEESPLKLYFSTENTSIKCQALLEGGTTKASVVIGFSEEEWITLQMDGMVKAISDPEALSRAKAVHYLKHPNSKKYENAPETMFLEFTPTWWRYTDYNTNPVTILGSE